MKMTFKQFQKLREFTKDVTAHPKFVRPQHPMIDGLSRIPGFTYACDAFMVDLCMVHGKASMYGFLFDWRNDKSEDIIRLDDAEARLYSWCIGEKLIDPPRSFENFQMTRRWLNSDSPYGAGLLYDDLHLIRLDGDTKEWRHNNIRSMDLEEVERRLFEAAEKEDR